MDRCALFIDAGHVQAGARVVLGLERGAPVRIHHAKLIPFLVSRAQAATGVPALRTYWYDAAVDAIPTPEQREIARVPNVKLRLGRLVNRRQKGVDALIIRDLMTLARERAIAFAYLVAGDEDLREGVLAVQDMGVQVALIGFPSRSGFGQAQTLIDEADTHMVFEDHAWREFVSKR